MCPDHSKYLFRVNLTNIFTTGKTKSVMDLHSLLKDKLSVIDLHFIFSLLRRKKCYWPTLSSQRQLGCYWPTLVKTSWMWITYTLQLEGQCWDIVFGEYIFYGIYLRYFILIFFLYDLIYSIFYFENTHLLFQFYFYFSFLTLL